MNSRRLSKQLAVLIAAAMLVMAVLVGCGGGGGGGTSSDPGTGGTASLATGSGSTATMVSGGNGPIHDSSPVIQKAQNRITTAKRLSAAARNATSRALAANSSTGSAPRALPPGPGGTPDYFGSTGNYANSPLPPSVTIDGAGVGAQATATITGGAVTRFTVLNGGSGYEVLPGTPTTVTVIGGGGTGATGTVTLTNGAVSKLVMTNSGSGYTSAPIVTFSGGTAAAIAQVSNGRVGNFIITNPGSGYTAPPYVTISGGGGTGAAANAIISDGVIASIAVTTPGSGYGTVPGLRKFVDALPTPPVAIPDTTAYPGSDYYEIAVGQYTQKLHTDLPPTTLRGYRQTNMGGTPYSYLGPIIVATKDRPVRIKFTNLLPTGAGGNLFIPCDTTVMGAGMGPTGGMYTQNRATLHLHGGNSPWISDGTAHQWTTPAGEAGQYPKGVSVQNVPDMPAAGPGQLTFYYTNQQSARLMFYHDHAYGITRLNVYAGEAAGYVITDSADQALMAAVGNPPQVPLVIQDKTFVPSASQLLLQDPTWNWGTSATPGQAVVGDLWFPHVYMPNQNPSDPMGANAMGRWDYGPWFWPPFTGIQNGPVANPLYDPIAAPWENDTNPGIPNPSIVPEAFMDTPLVNGKAYPYMKVGRKAYRFRVLNACNDRTLNLQLYLAKSNGQMWRSTGIYLLDGNAGEVNMVPAVPGTGLPSSWPTDGRDGGVPDPRAIGPSFIQIASEGGMLPAPVVLPNTPIGYIYNRKDITVLNVGNKTLFLGPAERADVIVDFSQLPNGTKVILYNDSPTPVPAFDPRYDYYTGNPDYTSIGGAPSTLLGYGPNTRTIMQFQVDQTLGQSGAFPLATLQAQQPIQYAVYQPKPLVPQAAYNVPFAANWPANAYARIQDTFMGWFNGGPLNSAAVVTAGTGYTSAPTVTITGGGGAGATATATLTGRAVNGVTVTAPGSGYTTSPLVSFTGGGGTGATATASINAGGQVTGVSITNGGTGYTSPPLVGFTGGGGTGAAATATLPPGSVGGITITNGGAGYTSAPTVAISGGGGTGATAKVFGVKFDMGPKAIQELFTVDYGRMNATLGVEMPMTNMTNQTTIPYGYVDPPTELWKVSDPVTPIGSLADGTQIWKITHNGVDTHAVHFHRFDVQLVNRVGWDGMVKAPDPNELGWKDTVRMNPLEDCIVAARPTTQVLPWQMPNSIRALDVTMPLGNTTMFFGVDPTGQPAPVTNQLMNFGAEYVWHCHLLGHEENDMMRTMSVVLAPLAPSSLLGTRSGSGAGQSIALSWRDNSMNETSFIVKRATNPNGPWTTLTDTVPPVDGTGATVQYTDSSVAPATTYYYQVFANNLVGYTQVYAPPAVGYPTLAVPSTASNTLNISTI